MTDCRKKVIPASAFLPIVNFHSPASAFQRLGLSALLVTDNKVKAIRQAEGRQQQVNRQESVKTAGWRQAVDIVLQVGRR